MLSVIIYYDTTTIFYIIFFFYIIYDTNISTTVFKILGQGFINITNDKNVTEVNYSPEIVENVIATSHLQQSGHKKIFPVKISDSGGAWITKINWDGKNLPSLTFFLFHDICSRACLEYCLITIVGYLLLICRQRGIVL